MDNISAQVKVEQLAQEDRERQQSERQSLERDAKTTPTETDAVLRRARHELAQASEAGVRLLAETAALRLERSDADRSGVGGDQVAAQVQPIERRFLSAGDLQAYTEQAWNSLQQSPEGCLLIQQVGGRDALLRRMEVPRFDFLTSVATDCQHNGLHEQTTGRLVHRLAELHTLEKMRPELLNGTREVEQRIDYTDQAGAARHVELDDVIRRGDRVLIRDYKPVNLSRFENTPQGQAWAEWAEKQVGPDFRQRIQQGASPFFHYETKGAMPREIQTALKTYLERVTEHHRPQLDKYKELYARASGVEERNIHISIRPYFKFSA